MRPTRQCPLASFGGRDATHLGAERYRAAGPNPYDPPGRQAWIGVIAHAAGITTWYAHVDDVTHPPLVKPGQRVHAGQVIAFEGDTGNTNGPAPALGGRGRGRVRGSGALL